MTGRIGIVYPFGNLDSVPCLVSAITLLNRVGYDIDVFTCGDKAHVAPVFEAHNVAVLAADVPPRGKRPLLLKPWSGAQYRWLQLQRRHRRSPYRCIIGVDPLGLRRANEMCGALGVPLIYYSLELLCTQELATPAELAIKAEERALSQKAAFSIVPGAERCELLRRDNGLIPEAVISVPNATLDPPARRRSRYLRERFAIDDRTRIIIQTGELMPWTGIADLAESTRAWPDNWLLFCHSRRVVNHYYHRAYLETLQRLAKPGSLLLSLDPVPREVYPELVRSADVGVAFYMPRGGVTYEGDNIRCIGRSSGKVAYYLQNGLPILVNDIPAHVGLAQAYGCGAVCASPAHTVEALNRVFDQYDRCSEGALKCFENEYAFETPFQQVLDRIAGLSSLA